MDIKKLKFNNLFPTTPKKPAPSSSGYAILDKFINSIMPMMQNQGMGRQERMRNRERRDENNMRRDEAFFNRPVPALPQISRSMLEPEKPMNVVLGNQLNPFQEATLGMRGRELESREALAKDKQTEVERRNQATEEEKKARLKILQDKEAKNDLSESEALELKFNRDMEKIRSGQRFTNQRDITQQGNALDRIDRTGELAAQGREVTGAQAMQRQNDAQAATTARDIVTQQNALGRTTHASNIKKEIAAGKPDTKQLVLQRVNELITLNPKYADYIEVDQNTGVIEIKPPSVPGKMWGNTVGPTPEEHQQIKEAIFGTDPTKATSTIIPPATEGPGSVVPEEIVIMITPDGRKIKVPKSKVPDAEFKGAKRVQ